jgi:hypothetical protein
MCKDRFGLQTPSYSGDVLDEQECEEICRGDRQCVAFAYSAPVCTIHGTIRTKPPAESSRNWAWSGGSVPNAEVVELAEIVLQGQRESVCRKKDEYGDKVLEDTAGKVEVSVVFAPLVLLAFFFVLMVVFCFRPLARAARTCIFGVPESAVVAENRLVVQSANTHLGADSGDEQELRKAGDVAMEPLPLEMSPSAPDSPPHMLSLTGGSQSPAKIDALPLDSPEPMTPSQALTPLTLPPTPGLEAQSGDSPSAGSASQTPQRKGGWKRPAAGKGRKQAWKDAPEEEKAPRAGKQSQQMGDYLRQGRGPNVAPASVANSAHVGLGLGMPL